MSTEQTKPLVAIVGPTAIGKTEWALRLAQQFDGEIIGADSRQVYRRMDIGTAKPTPEERALVPHHVVDIIEPDEPFSLALYEALAYEAMRRIQEEGKLPILAGGSGLYLWAVMEGWQIPEVPPDPQFRSFLQKRAEREGQAALHAELRVLDPAAAGRIDPRNVRRVIRALEVIKKTGLPFSQQRRKDPPASPILILGLTANRDSLYRRIDDRVDQMVQEGLVEEAGDLLDRGYSPDLPSMSSMGYRQITQHLRGEKPLPEAIQETKFETHRFARHQYSWFRPADPKIRWFDVSEDIEKPLMNLVDATLAQPPIRS
jgi:tRNA dimethylallyltransferase